MQRDQAIVNEFTSDWVLTKLLSDFVLRIIHVLLISSNLDKCYVTSNKILWFTNQCTYNSGLVGLLFILLLSWNRLLHSRNNRENTIMFIQSMIRKRDEYIAQCNICELHEWLRYDKYGTTTSKLKLR